MHSHRIQQTSNNTTHQVDQHKLRMPKNVHFATYTDADAPYHLLDYIELIELT